MKSGPMAGHVQDGRVFRSPLAATGVLNIADWVRHDLPDLLWPVAVLSEGGTDQGSRFLRWQDAVHRDLAGVADAKIIGEGLDGRLTGLDRLAAAVPESQMVLRARALENGLLSEPVMRLLASYPDRPAAWFTDREFAPPGRDEVNALARAIYEAVTDGHREAMVKYITIRGNLLAGTISLDPAMAELLQAYPGDAARRARADSVIRASWGSEQAAVLYADANRFDVAHAWARVFWVVNSMTTRCRRKADESRDTPTRATEPGNHETEDDSGSSLTEAALLLRHSDKRTTERHYARAMQERAHDRARRAVQIDQSASLPERLDALWEAWVGAFPTVLARLGMDVDNVIDLGARRGRA